MVWEEQLILIFITRIYLWIDIYFFFIILGIQIVFLIIIFNY